MWIATNDAIHLLKRSIYHLKPRLNEIEQQLRSIRKSPYKIVKLVKQASSSSDWVGVSSRSIMSALLQSLIDSHFRLDWVSRFGSSHLNHCCFFSWRIFSSFCSLSVIESLVLFFLFHLQTLWLSEDFCWFLWSHRLFSIKIVLIIHYKHYDIIHENPWIYFSISIALRWYFFKWIHPLFCLSHFVSHWNCIHKTCIRKQTRFEPFEMEAASFFFSGQPQNPFFGRHLFRILVDASSFFHFFWTLQFRNRFLGESPLLFPVRSIMEGFHWRFQPIP